MNKEYTFKNIELYSNFLYRVLENKKVELIKKNVFNAYTAGDFVDENLELKGPIVFVFKKINPMFPKIPTLQSTNKWIGKKAINLRRGKVKSLVFIVSGYSEKELPTNYKYTLENDIRNGENTELLVSFLGDETIERWIKEFPVDYIRSQGNTIRLGVNGEIDKFKKKDFTENSENEINRLKKDIKNRNLSLILGAGVSVDYGALSWSKLVNAYEEEVLSLKNQAITDKLKDKLGSTNLIHAQLYKDMLGEDEFIKRLYKSLYGEYSKDKLKINTTLFEVANFINESSTKMNIRVLTYNYDDFLEQYIKEHHFKIKYNVVYNESGLVNGNTPIYHVHGYLPYGFKMNDKHSKDYMDSIKLTEDDYNFLYNNPYTWQIQTQLELFRKTNCLFIGCSLTDPNIRRLLKLSKESEQTHYSIMNAKGLTKYELSMIEKHFEGMGVRIIWAESFNDYSSIIKELRDSL